MKLALIVACSLLVGCATGVVDDPEPQVTTVTTAPQRPAPVPAPEESDAAPPIKCVVDAHWVNNCYVVAIYCEGKDPRVEVSCGPGRPLWPWEIIPDPPYDRKGNRE